MSEPRIRVFLVDDQQMVRAGFRMLVDSQDDMVVVREGTEFDWVVPHTYRKTVATLMDRGGLSARTIADQLGHKDTRMLANHYRHQIRPTIDAALILDDVLNRPDN